MTDTPSNPQARDTTSSSSREELRARTLADELERRLELFDQIDDDEFGRFTRVDWTICTVGFFVLPILIAWWGL